METEVFTMPTRSHNPLEAPFLCPMWGTIDLSRDRNYTMPVKNNVLHLFVKLSSMFNIVSNVP